MVDRFEARGLATRIEKPCEHRETNRVGLSAVQEACCDHRESIAAHVGVSMSGVWTSIVGGEARKQAGRSLVA